MKASCYKGQLLVAMPSLMDPFFSRSVTCICEHKEEGAFGIVINQIHENITEKDFFSGLDIEYHQGAGGKNIHCGGPVQRYNVFVLHGEPFYWQNCFSITDMLAMSSTIDILQAIARGDGPEKYLIATGCAGWAPGQLEAEMQKNAWIICPMDEGLLFNTPADERWEVAMGLLGIDPVSIPDGAGHA